MVSIKKLGFQNMSALCKMLNLSSDCNWENLDVGTDEEQVSEKYKSETVLAGVVVATCVFALLGNSVVLLAHRGKCGTRSYYVWLNGLACSDIFSAIFLLLHYLPRFWTVHWIYEEVGCRLISSAINIGANVAIGSVFIISVDRLIGIRYPFRGGMSKRIVCCLFVVNVVVAVVVVLPHTIIARSKQEWEHITIGDRGGEKHLHEGHILRCVEYRGDDIHAKMQEYDIAYACFLFTLYTVTPILLMGFIYIIVFRTLRQRLRVLSGEHNAAAKLRRVQQNRHTMLLLVAVLFAFILFTLPSKMKWLLGMIWSSSTPDPKRHRIFHVFHLISDPMYPIHTAVNPFIYTACDRSFRAKVRTIFGHSVDKIGCAMMAYRQWVLRFLYRIFTCLYGFKFQRYEIRDPVTFSTRIRSSTRITMLQESPTVTPVPKPRKHENTTGL